MSSGKCILWPESLSDQQESVIGQTAHQFSSLEEIGLKLPPWFLLTSQAFKTTLKHQNLSAKIAHYTSSVDPHDPHQLQVVCQRLSQLISQGELPKPLWLDILEAYHRLKSPLVTLKLSLLPSSPPPLTFKPVFIHGDANLIDAIRHFWTKLITPRSISTTILSGQPLTHLIPNLVIQQVLPATASGTVFLHNPLTQNKHQLLIQAVSGLPYDLLKGSITVDHYFVTKNPLHLDQKQIVTSTSGLFLDSHRLIEKSLGSKGSGPKLSDSQILSLSKTALKTSQLTFFPQYFEWSLVKHQFYLTHTRSIIPTLNLHQEKSSFVPPAKIDLKKLFSGLPGSPGIISGPVRIIHKVTDFHHLKPGDIVIIDHLDYPINNLKKAAAIISHTGGATSLPVIAIREQGIPAIVSAPVAANTLKTGQVITINGQTGDVYAGGLNLSTLIHPSPINPISSPISIKTATKLMVNLSNPEELGAIPKDSVDGVGLLRAEFLLESLKDHPQEYLKSGQASQFTSALTEKIALFCRHFQALPIIYRPTDFTSIDFKKLQHGHHHEPDETHPLLGLRGASRYLARPELFLMEVKAIKALRHQGFSNLHLMLPFVRTVSELTALKGLLNQVNLTSSASFKIWLLAEIPSNVILLKDFIAAGIDGVSIGSNDLTMLTLGIDRDNSEISHHYQPLDPALLATYQTIITTSKQLSIPTSFSGQAASLYPELIGHLVDWGIDSISVSPDMITQARDTIYQAEKKKLTAITS